MQQKPHVLSICYIHSLSYPISNLIYHSSLNLNFTFLEKSTVLDIFNFPETPVALLCPVFFSEDVTHVSYTN